MGNVNVSKDMKDYYKIKTCSCDLHNEHINRLCKDAMGNLGPGISKRQAVARIGKSILELEKVLTTYDSENGVKKASGFHRRWSVKKDLAMVVKVLKEAKVDMVVPKRCHEHFKKLQSNVNTKLDDKSFKLWILEHAKKWLVTSQRISLQNNHMPHIYS